MLMLRQDELPRQARDKRSTTETLDDAKTKRAVGGRFVCWLTAAPRSAKKRISPFELSLCLSRACLGKSIIFSIKWRKNGVSLTDHQSDHHDGQGLEERAQPGVEQLRAAVEPAFD